MEGKVLTDKLQELVDRQEISDVLISYARFVDKRDFASLVGLFTEDAVANYQGPELKGHEQLDAFFRETLADVEATHHQIGNIEIFFDGPDDAQAKCYATAWHVFPGGEELTLHGTYLDRLKRTPSGWKLSERRPKGSRHETKKLLERWTQH
jgi:ketosteroid isomerase-like protein